MSPIRSLTSSVLAVALLFSLASCTPVIPNAWLLGQDGTLGFADCSEFRASRVEVAYLRSGVAVAQIVAEGEERSFGGGHQLWGLPERWLVSSTMTMLPEWDAVRLTFWAAPFPLGTSQTSNRRTSPDALDQVGEAEIPRSQLRIDEWVWDEPGAAGCDILPGSSGDPVYSEALAREAYEQLLAEHPDLDSLADALADLDRIAPILAFQSLLLEEVTAAALPDEDLDQSLARIRPTAAPYALLAAELAVTRLGFVWDEAAVRAPETD